MSKAQQVLRDALFSSGLVQPVDSSGRGGSVSILCRQLQGQEKSWLQVVDALLQVAEESSIDVHVCRRYVRKAGQMVFGWSVGVTAPNAKGLVDAVEKLLPVFSSVAPLPAVRREVDAPARPPPVGLVHGTTAHPRQPEVTGPDPTPPPEPPRIRVVRSGIDESGQAHVITEMPLPHAYGDINKPRPGSTKGATFTTGGGRPT